MDYELWGIDGLGRKEHLSSFEANSDDEAVAAGEAHHKETGRTIVVKKELKEFKRPTSMPRGRYA